jgi:hypothetical protein
MNIFVLDKNPKIAAQMACDKHCVKMILESAQLLCSPYPPGTAPYRRTHYNHPCSKWVRESEDNYLWLLDYASSLCEEYHLRYGRYHKSSQIIQWCKANIYKLNFKQTKLTSFPQCMPSEYKNPNVVIAYRNYYMGEKASFAKWKAGGVPEWWVNEQ